MTNNLTIILGTMEEEVAYFRTHPLNVQVEAIGQWGKVAAAAKTQHLIDTYHPARIILVGTAGAIHPNLHHLDVVQCDLTWQWDTSIPLDIIRAYPNNTDLCRERGTHSYKARRCVTGDSFITNKSRFMNDADCVDMEADAVAQVCEMNGVDYLIFKCISDNADGSAAQDFAEFLPSASEKLYQAVSEVV